MPCDDPSKHISLLTFTVFRAFSGVQLEECLHDLSSYLAGAIWTQALVIFEWVQSQKRSGITLSPNVNVNGERDEGRNPGTRFPHTLTTLYFAIRWFWQV